jgi:hypothetical protein
MTTKNIKKRSICDFICNQNTFSNNNHECGCNSRVDMWNMLGEFYT